MDTEIKTVICDYIYYLKNSFGSRIFSYTYYDESEGPETFSQIYDEDYDDWCKECYSPKFDKVWENIKKDMGDKTICIYNTDIYVEKIQKQLAPILFKDNYYNDERFHKHWKSWNKMFINFLNDEWTQIKQYDIQKIRLQKQKDLQDIRQQKQKGEMCQLLKKLKDLQSKQELQVKTIKQIRQDIKKQSKTKKDKDNTTFRQYNRNGTVTTVQFVVPESNP